jgi:hypothetical protein
VELSEGARFGVNIGVLLAAVVYSRWAGLRRGLRLPFRVFGFVFSALDRAFTMVLVPAGYLIGKFSGLFTHSTHRGALPESGND